MRRTSNTTIHLTREDITLLMTREGGIKGECPAARLGIDDFQVMLKGYVSEEPNSWTGFCSEDAYWNGESFELDDTWEQFSIWCRDKQERDEIFNRVYPVLVELRKQNK